MELAGKHALVTGAGKGIGRATVLLLAEAGARVTLVSRTTADLESCAAEARACNVQALPLTADVARVEDVRALFAGARAALGPIDVLVNGAGVAPSALVHKTSDEQWRAALEINLSGAFYCLREALPEMTARGWGRVVNVASIAGKTGYPYIAAYAASKHGLLGLTKCAALEVANAGVTVNAVCPGYVDTPMTDASIARIAQKTQRDPAEALRHLIEASPQKRLFTAEEVAALILFLCGEDARGITGQAISLDGGTVV
jgi:3-hydroxybutyrate dehydrogenase